MLSFSIIESEMRGFMNKLLREEVFDFFEVRGVELASFARFEINGILDKDFLSEDMRGVDRSYCTWKELRPYVFDIIKGKRPKSFKIVFSLPTERLETLHKNASACFLNLTYDGSEVLCTVAVSERIFAMDRSIENAWQEVVTDFFKQSKITVRRN